MKRLISLIMIILLMITAIPVNAIEGGESVIAEEDAALSEIYTATEDELVANEGIQVEGIASINEDITEEDASVSEIAIDQEAEEIITDAEWVGTFNEGKEIITDAEQVDTFNEEEEIVDESRDEYLNVDIAKESQEQIEHNYENNIESVEEIVPELIEENGESPEEEISMLGSMLPLEEVRAYLVLEDKTEAEVQNFPVTEVLSNLRDSEGNPVEIEESSSVVWTYIRDEQGNVIRDEYHELNKSETVDLSAFEYSGGYSLDLIVGNGKQLDSSAVRYLVRVYLTNQIPNTVDFEIYEETDTRHKVIVNSADPILSSLGFLNIISTFIVVDNYQSGNEYYLGVTSSADDHPDIKLDIYSAAEFQNLLINGVQSAQSLNDQMLNQDMERLGAGYRSTFESNTEIYSMSDNMFAFVYSDQATGRILDYEIRSYIVSGSSVFDAFTTDISSPDGSEIYEAAYNKFDFERADIQIGKGVIGGEGVQTYAFLLKEGISHNGDYHVSFALTNSDTISVFSKVVEGRYNTFEEAEGQADIKDLIFVNSSSQEVKGYLTSFYGEGTEAYKEFTLFKKDGSSPLHVLIALLDYEEDLDPNYMERYFATPVVGQKDPWFRVTGLQLDGRTLETYAVENGKAVNMDTYYGYGYQTLMVMDSLTPDEMSRLVPIFEVGNPDRVQVRTLDSTEPLTSGVDTVDFSDNNGTEQFIAIIDGNSKNYQVHVLTKESGPKLYVYDDYIDKSNRRFREVILDDYFEEKHDILIANIGDVPLSGLKVKLDATNVKLDDYWTIGGDGNDTLEPFTTVKDKSEYGLIPNIAKVRLVPDGEGDIEGKVTISADNQEDVVIYISNHPRQPEIVNERFENAVKYVPYSYMVATNNMYDWNDENYSVVEGELPPGMNIYPSTGEIYGAPLSAGTYTFVVQATYSRDDYFEPSRKEFTITVEDNENQIVYETSDEGYEIIPLEDGDIGYVGNQVSDYDFLLESLDKDEVYISNGVHGEFVKLWLNGTELTNGTDYVTEEGSTKIIIRSQTLKENVREGRNTISAEFNVDGERGDQLKRTSQNFRYEAPEVTEKPGKGEKTISPKPDDTTSAPDTPALPLDNQEEPASENAAISITTTVVDKNGNPLSNYILELHSRVQTGTTDTSGIAEFTGVEMGGHVMYVKDSSGETVTTKRFTLVAGDAFAANGDTYTVVPGQMLSMTITLNKQNSTAQVVTKSGGTEKKTPSVTSDNANRKSDKATNNASATTTPDSQTAVSSNANTGDDSNIALYGMIVIMSFIMLGATLRQKKI